jgi:trigger factor
MVEVADFAAIHEEDAIAKPVEAIGQDDLALCACGGAVNINGGTHLVAIAQIDLALVGNGECMGLPKRHVSIIAGKGASNANRYTPKPVKSTFEALEGNQVKLSIEVDESEFDKNIDAAFRKIAHEVRLPGFRPGKAPRRVLEARIGIDAARGQAINDAIPEYLSKAVIEHKLDIIAQPDVNLLEGQESGVVKFEATVEVRPVIQVPGYAGLRVELVNPALTDEEMEEAITTERRRFGSLVDVDRAAAVGDNVVIDLEGLRGGEPVPGLNVDEWTYEVGRGWVAPGFDDQLTGAKKGDTLKFSAVPNGTEEEADFVVTVNRVQTLEIPELSDAWVAENISDADTIEEWKTALRARYEEMRINQMRRTVVDRLTDELEKLVEIEAPESMVSNDLQARVQNTLQQFQSQGIALDQWLSATGQDADSFIAGMKTQSEKAVKIDLALRAVAVAQNITVSDEDLEAEYESIGVRVGEKTAKVRKAYEQNDAVTDLIAQMTKSQALEWLLRNVAFVDQNGTVLDTDTVLGEHDHDHDHDHDGHDHD